jgi:ribonuclease HII
MSGSSSNKTATKPKKAVKPVSVLEKFMNPNVLEMGIDEAGRGPLFGRVYASAVVLPKDDSFPHELMKDSKKFTSRKRLDEVAKIIMDKAIAFSVKFAESEEIDKLNPLKATMRIMNQAAHEVIAKLSEIDEYKGERCNLLVDGSYFRPVPFMDSNTGQLDYPDYTCVTSGDNTYTSIAAASILAKYHRDNYIDEMCETHPGLNELYDLAKNKGYGTAKHMAAIKQYGITRWHRRSFGLCKSANVIDIEVVDAE